MIFLDQKSIKQTHAVILPATHGDGVFLCHPETGNCLSRVQDLDVGMGHLLDQLLCCRCHS